MGRGDRAVFPAARIEGEFLGREIATDAVRQTGRRRRRRRRVGYADGDIAVEGDRVLNRTVGAVVSGDVAYPDIAGKLQAAEFQSGPAELQQGVGGRRLLRHLIELGRQEAPDRTRPVADRGPLILAHTQVLVAEKVRPPGGQGVHVEEGELPRRRAEEAAAEGPDVDEALRIALEGARRRMIVDVPECALAGFQVPVVGDVAPVEGAVAHRLLPIGVAHADLQGIQPAGVELILSIHAGGGFTARAVLNVVHHVVVAIVVGVAQTAWRLVDVGRVEQGHDRPRARRIQAEVGEGILPDLDVVALDRRMHALHVEVDAKVVGRVPLQMDGPVLGHVPAVVEAGDGVDVRRPAREGAGAVGPRGAHPRIAGMQHRLPA